ncbi:MAG: glycosyltransferase family 4 protein [Bdellovibrionales bacterium]|nr:glycosyltransferase family 4 protein [Bdellovibrionales bacterium]
MFSKLRLAFVLPRYYADVVGGAETLTGNLALQAQARGAAVEIWTTCARDNRTWANAFPAGTSDEGGLTVRRFSVDERDLEKWIPRQIQLSEGMPLSVHDQFIWMEEGVNSRDLYNYIQKNGESFDLLIFAPYLFGTTFWGSLVYPERSALIPCLHDEPNAYLEVIASMFRQVRGCFFNCNAEMQLARSLYGSQIPGGIVGMGFEQSELTSHTPYFSEEFPYLLYLGRMETGKNVHTMLDYFVESKERGALPEEFHIVIAGAGSFEDLQRPQYQERSDVIAVGRVNEEDKRALLKHAIALVQPSVMESFCIVMMEGWLEGTPALVHENCDVTKHHIHQAEGGLTFRSSESFGEAVGRLFDDSQLRQKFGAAGRRYVEEVFSWEAVMERFDEVVSQLLNDSKSPSAVNTLSS